MVVQTRETSKSEPKRTEFEIEHDRALGELITCFHVFMHLRTPPSLAAPPMHCRGRQTLRTMSRRLLTSRCLVSFPLPDIKQI